MSGSGGSTASADGVLAVVLAGGRGTRLEALTRRCAKPAVAFGGDFRIIDYTLSNCVNSGIRQVAVLTQYEGRGVARHLQRCWRGGGDTPHEFVEAWPAQQDIAGGGYEGTADAVRKNLREIRALGCERVLVLGGDHVYTMDYRALVAAHAASGAGVTVACTEVPLAEAAHCGVVQLDARDRILDLAEKPENPVPLPLRPDRASVSMGIYLFDTDLLADVLCASDVEELDFGRHVLPELIRAGEAYAYRFVDDRGEARYWRDVGTVRAYFEASMELLRADVARQLCNPDWPVVTDAFCAPAVRLEPDADGRDARAVNAILGRGCRLVGASVREAVVSRDVTLGPGTTVTRAVLLPGARIGRDCRLEDVIVDAGCRVPDGTVILGSHGAARRAGRVPFTDDDLCRVVTQEMIDGAAAERLPAQRSGPATAALAALASRARTSGRRASAGS